MEGNSSRRSTNEIDTNNMATTEKENNRIFQPKCLINGFLHRRKNNQKEYNIIYVHKDIEMNGPCNKGSHVFKKKIRFCDRSGSMEHATVVPEKRLYFGQRQ
jgi:hypothetical protein